MAACPWRKAEETVEHPTYSTVERSMPRWQYFVRFAVRVTKRPIEKGGAWQREFCGRIKS